MKSHTWLPLAVLIGLAAPVSAQTYGPGPSGAPYGMPPGMAQPPAMPQPMPQQMPGQGEAPAGAQAMREAMQARMMQKPAVQASLTLKEGIEKMIAFMSQEPVPNKLQTAAFLDREIAPYFDFDYMARWVAGPAWTRMSDADKTAMAARLEEGFLTALGGQLAGYQGQQVKVQRPRQGARGSVSIPVAISGQGGYPARMEFRMYKSDGGWKVYDVLANGRSAASYYRTRFQRMGMGAGQATPPGR